MNAGTVSMEYLYECIGEYSYANSISYLEVQPFTDTVGLVSSSSDACDLLTSVLYDIYERDPQVLGQLACVFDIDDTLIFSMDNSPNMPVVGLLYLCIELGIHVYVVTARGESSREYTLDQLEILLGVRLPSAHLYMAARTQPPEVEKRMAREHISKRYPILFSIGDQPHDIGDGCGLGVVLLPYY